MQLLSLAAVVDASPSSVADDSTSEAACSSKVRRVADQTPSQPMTTSEDAVVPSVNVRVTGPLEDVGAAYEARRFEK